MTVWKGRNGAGPFWPNFAADVEVEHEFDTRINLSRSGAEQRTAWWPFPRMAVTYDSWSRTGRRYHDAALRQNPAGLIAVPVGYHRTFLGTAAGTGDTTLSLTEDVPDWLRPNSLVLIHGPDSDEAATVNSRSGNNLLLASGILGSFPAGAEVYPAAWAQRITNKGYQMMLRGFETTRQRYDLDPSVPVIPYIDASWTNLGLEVFPWRADFGNPPEREENPLLEIVDGIRGNRVVFAPHEWEGYSRTEEHVLHGEQEVEEWIDFFLRHRGRQKRFWAPTYAPSFVLGPVAYADENPTTGAGLPFGFDQSATSNYPQDYPESGGPDMFVLTGADGTTVTRNRLRSGPGEMGLPVIFGGGLFGSGTNQVFRLVNLPYGPTREHFERGLVSLQCRVFCTYVDGQFPSGGPNSPAQLQFEIWFDHQQSEDEEDRYNDDRERISGQFIRTHQGGVSQDGNGSSPLIDVSFSLPVPSDAWFTRISLRVTRLGTGDDILTTDHAFSLVWSGLDDNDVIEFDEPVTLSAPITAEPYGIYRFEQDRLTTVLRTDTTAQSTVTLKLLNEPVLEDE